MRENILQWNLLFSGAVQLRVILGKLEVCQIFLAIFNPRLRVVNQADVTETKII